MNFALSTNWCNLRLESGREIAEQAKALGFTALELGFHTTARQAREIRDCGLLPIGSIHAFCPVPLSAPQGYPELYQLAAFDEAARALAAVHVKKNIAFAAEMGADAVVLHAGRVMCRGWFKSRDWLRRVKRGRKLVEIFKRELEALVPELEKHRVTLALENLPYLEGFPAEWELAEVCGEWVRPWLDLGHDFVRRQHGWPPESPASGYSPSADSPLAPVGLHIHDSQGGDDHLPPGEGKVDFAAWLPFARNARHLVFEPHAEVGAAELRRGLDHLRQIWKD